MVINIVNLSHRVITIHLKNDHVVQALQALKERGVNKVQFIFNDSGRCIYKNKCQLVDTV